MRFLKISAACLAIALCVSPAGAQFGRFPGRQPERVDNAEAMVTRWYERFLERQPDYPGASGWIQLLRQGQRPESVLANILGSQEYYEKAGSTLEGYVRTLHRDLFGRPPTRREYGFWMPRANRQTRRDVAYDMLVRTPGNW